MDVKEFQQIAFDRGLVQWERSGIIEKLRISKRGKTIAVGILEGSKPHMIHLDQHPVLLCRHLTRDEKVSLADLSTLAGPTK